MACADVHVERVSERLGSGASQDGRLVDELPEDLRDVLAQVVVDDPQPAGLERQRRHQLVPEAVGANRRGTVHVVPVVDVETTMRASPVIGSGRSVA